MPADTLHPEDGPCPLALTEIRLHIFRELNAKSLLNAALVCKAWAWSAIDTLWRYEWVPLSAILAKVNSQSLLDWLTDVGSFKAVSAELWTRCQSEYTAKVRAVKIDFHPTETFNEHLDSLISPHAGPICPNLLSLEYDIDNYYGLAEVDHWTPLLQLLVGPKLERLILQIGDVTREVVKDNIRTLARIAPQICDVAIRNYSDFSYNYASFTELKDLRVSGYITHPSWKSLSNCPRLERIILWEDGGSVQVDPEDCTVTFSSLKRLAICECCGYRIAEFIVFLCKNTVMPALFSLQVEIRESGEARREAAKMDILESVCRRSPKLKEVYINGRVDGYDDVSLKAVGH
ncbi:hypothetical protein FRB96_007161 [Tulasnella sp. 330]|nr:hypothetical protein FRB96_007161 [Tulasnella sp. 330]KAG8878127.1 hypothetical protein FRB97_002809 [Tulasnella sp. 331]